MLSAKWNFVARHINHVVTEQRCAIKFCVKLGTETFTKFTKAYGDEALSRASVNVNLTTTDRIMWINRTIIFELHYTLSNLPDKLIAMREACVKFVQNKNREGNRMEVVRDLQGRIENDTDLKKM